MMTSELDNTSVLDASLDMLDPSLPARFETDTHGPVFARLRRHRPVHRCPESPYGPYWSVTRLEDIVAVEADPATWSSNGNIIIGDVPPDFAAPAFATSDPPQHGLERRAVAPSTSPDRMVELTPAIRARIDAILDGIPTHEPIDWAAKVAGPLTAEIVALLFDWPRAERDLLPHWCEVMTTTPQPGAVVETETERRDVLMAYQQRLLQEWLVRLGRLPARDIISCLAHHPATVDMIATPERLVGTVSMIAGANEAARSAISGAILAFHLFPQQWEALRADPTLIPRAVKEVVRWQTPVLHMRRTATRDAILGGETIRRGEKVVLWYCSGNRDEAFYPDGDDFRLDRANLHRHVGFGFGIHRCFGRHVANTELLLLLEAILKRFRRIEVLEAPFRYRSNFASGYQRLMVRLHPA